MNDFATKQDLKDCSAEIKEHIELIVKPIVDQQIKHEKILHGISGMNGLVGDQKILKNEQKSNRENTSFKLKIIYALLVFIAAAIVKIEIWGL